MNAPSSACTVAGLFLAFALAAAPAPGGKVSFWERLKKIAGVSATPSQMKGADDDMPGGGQIWLATSDTGRSRVLSGESGFRSPVFTPDGGAVLTIRSNAIWRIPIAGGAPVKLHEMAGLSKLVGFDQEDTNQLCVLLAQERVVSVQLLSIVTLQATLIDYDADSREDRRWVTHLKRWDRSYGETSVYTEKQRKAGLGSEIEWNDIFVKRGSEVPINVSRADGKNCGHPSLAQDGTQVVFIKEP